SAPVPRQRNDSDHAQHACHGRQSSRYPGRTAGGRGPRLPPLRGRGIHRRCAADRSPLRALSRRRLPARGRAVAGAEPALGSREPGIRGSRGMTTTSTAGSSRPGSALTGLLASAAALTLLGAGTYYFLATHPAAAAALPPAVAIFGPVAFGVVAALLLGGGAFMAKRLHRTVADQRLAADTQRQENDRNQQAILRLLDELSSLADGDLTVQATVTEDITGAIADSINYAVDALRGLVTTINQSAIQLDGATRQTQALSQHLAKASGAQSKQIASATEYAGGMAGSVAEVSGNAERAADVARHSVEVAHKGGDAVRRTIDGMNTIRETIQETSKRIKRLGESSQEIGNIVELINDIA